ncbi:MAG: polysaccharide deacetylase family protein [Bacteroidetes bacterium]|nr:polysaccharide deacetylase family protein [Bacteroidota bacterium]
MNVLLTLSQLEVTGAELYSVLLADSLIERGDRAIIVSDTLTRSTNADYVPLDINNRSLFNRARHVRFLCGLIRDRGIDIVHAHSRASSWVSAVAARICGIPMVTTVHGRQPVHTSRKLFKAFGDATIAICESVHDHLVNDHGVSPDRIVMIRNGVRMSSMTRLDGEPPPRPVVSIIGRLSGPKGEIARMILRDLTQLFEGVHFRVIGGKTLPPEFDVFADKVEFIGYVDDVIPHILSSSVVIGAGRVAMKALAHGIPTVAVGEARTIGQVRLENWHEALRTNFGDIASEHCHDIGSLANELGNALRSGSNPAALTALARREFDAEQMAANVRTVYARTIEGHRNSEIPVLLYHRVVERREDAGRHGIYVLRRQFERQLRYLKRKGIRCITFRQYEQLSPHERRTGRFVILTFDDGYRDNYTIAFPLLKKYGATGVVYLVTDRNTNEWDQHDGEPMLELLRPGEIAEMHAFGIEFGAHTLTHPHLTELCPGNAAYEITESQRALERMIGGPVTGFCYPYGELNEDVKRMVRQAGFKFGIASASGPLSIENDRYEVRRIQVFPGTGMSGFRRKVSGNYLHRKLRNNRYGLQSPATLPTQTAVGQHPSTEHGTPLQAMAQEASIIGHCGPKP